MKTSKSLFSLLILLCAVTAQAQMYKWVGPDGKITYSDVPPPANAKQVETKSVSSGGPSTANLPYELAEAVKNSPVRLYTTPTCSACDEGRKLLNTRGIPFIERTVSSNADLEQLRQIHTGDPKFPMLFIGRHKKVGFENRAWNDELTTAGYPETNKLPRTYQNASAEPLAPTPKAPSDNQPARAVTPNPTTNIEPRPPAAGNAPPGFRF